MDEGFRTFANEVRRLDKTRVHRVRNSYGIYDGFKYYRRFKPSDSKFILSESQYFAITRRVNELMAESLSQGNDIPLPEKLGRLEVRKYATRMIVNGNKVKTNLPVDWDRTLKLWYEDEDAYTNKTLIKMEEDEIFKVYYNRVTANFTNKSFYQFNVNRDLKRKLKQSIKGGSVDAFTI